MDNHRNIVFIQSGFLEHNNDSGQLQIMPRIGPGEQLHLPLGLYILADKGYPLARVPPCHIMAPNQCCRSYATRIVQFSCKKRAGRHKTLYSSCERAWSGLKSVASRYECWMFPKFQLLQSYVPFWRKAHNTFSSSVTSVILIT